MILSAPIYVHWELTDRCNLKCKHCYQKNSLFASECNLTECMSIAEQLVENKVFQVTLTGGEPLLFPAIFELVDYLVENRIKPRITTNGYFINNQIAAYFAKHNLHIQVSLDSANYKEHNFIRNSSDAFDKAINAIKLLVNYNVPVSVAFCVNNLNYKSMENFIELLISMNVRQALIGEIVPNNQGNKALFFTKEQYIEFISLANVLWEKYRNKIDVTFDTDWAFLFDDKIEHSPCSALDRDLAIMPNGDVLPCPFIRNEYYILGNILNESLEKIWSSEKANYFRNNKFSGCNESCSYYFKCLSGCKATIANNGEPIERRNLDAPCFQWGIV